MPTKLSAKKRVRQTITRTARNRAVKSRLNTSIRRFIEALENKDEESTELRFREAVRTIDKATSKGVIHRNNAARKKARMYKLFQKSREQ